MMSKDVIDKYSVPLEEQMMKIARIEPDFVAAVQKTTQTCYDTMFIDDVVRTFNSIGGKPGDAALEVYRDLGENISTLSKFLQRHESKKQNPDYSLVIIQVERVLAELKRLDDLVKQTPIDIMKQIKTTIKHGRYITATDKEKYEFKASSFVMLAAFCGVILLRYFEVIRWSWYIVVPIAIGAMVVIPALVSTLRFGKRGY